MAAGSQPYVVPRTRDLLGLAWPVVVSRSTQVVTGLADAIMVAGLGEEALAATTTGSLNTFIVFVFPFGLASIVASFSSQLYGAGDLAGARRYGFYGLGLAAATQVLGVIAALVAPAVLAQTSFAPAVRTLMGEYLLVRFMAAGPALGIEALANYYAGVGNTRLPMLASLGAMVLNVFGNWLLIFGHLGLPALGVAGAALASALSTTIGFGALLACFLAGAGAPGGRVRSRLRWGEGLRMLRFGIPAGFNWLFEFGAYSYFVNGVMAGLGTAAVAALNAVMAVNSVSFMPAFGVANAGAVLVGQAIGAAAADAVPRIVRLTLRVTAAWQCLMGAAYVLAPDLLLSAFGDGASADFLAYGRGVLVLSAAWQLFDAVSLTTGEALRAAGDTAFPMWSRVALAWLVFVPGALATVRLWGGGPVAGAGWLLVYLVALAGVLVWRFRRGAWRSIDLAGARAG